mgnify:CR=1 FL=1
MNVKIATITCHNVYNHGASLQAYALVEYLRTLGHDVEIINYRPDLSGNTSFYTDVPKRYERFGLRWAYILAKVPSRIRESLRRRKFDEFSHQYLPVTETLYHCNDELISNPPIADVYVAGSDQIWNTELRQDAAFYLNFGGNSVRKVSYAASFATASLKQGTEAFVKMQLSNFDRIGVREESGLRILESLGFEGALTVDPVFLLSAEHWSTVADTEGSDEDYILVYDFERVGPIEKVVKRMSRLCGCPVYSIGFEGKSYTSRDYVRCGPQTFVSLIKNARCVLSNSFHATAFAMIFNKRFFVVNRTDGLNVRMSDLLSRYGLQDRLIDVSVSDEGLREEINYDKVQTLLTDDIARSKQYLGEICSI